MQSRQEFFTEVAYAISRAFDVYIVFPILIAICFIISIPDSNAIVWACIYFVALVCMPIAGDIYLLKKKKISDFDITKREQRTAYLIDSTYLLFALAVISGICGAPHPFLATAIILFFIETIYSVITNYWKISVHAELVTLLCVYSIVLVNRDLWPMLIAIPLVFFARMYLHMHSFMQLFCGSWVSAMVALLILHWFHLA